MKIGTNDLRSGHTIKHKGGIYKIIKTQHVKPGKGGAYVQVQMKNIFNHAKISERFRSADSVEQAFLSKKPFKFLYVEQDDYWFLDIETYEQISLKGEDIDDNNKSFLIGDLLVDINFYETQPIGLNLPETIVAEVLSTDSTVKKQTVSSSYKQAIVANNVCVMVPQHIKTGDKISISTSECIYIKKES